MVKMTLIVCVQPYNKHVCTTEEEEVKRGGIRERERESLDGGRGKGKTRKTNERET